ncbi:MAG TPA: hypothetical protein VHQ87_08690 [Rhizobacter sp.]|jgi:hypothetical protein|nr:hypothetical protein [Rhizobacter sp.]
MNPWMTEAARLARLRAPLLTAERARDLADDLHKQCSEWTPAKAVAWFFSFMPPGWNASHVAAQDLPSHSRHDHEVGQESKPHAEASCS